MNNSFEQFKTDYRKIGLTSGEKRALRTTLSERMNSGHPQQSPYVSWATFSVRALAFALIGMIATGSGLTYASMNTLPGDNLYSFKINVVEEVAERMRLQPTDRALYAIERMARRLDEAEQLALKSELTQEHQRNISDKALIHAQRAYDILDENERILDQERSHIHARIDRTLGERADRLAHLSDEQPDLDSLLALAHTTRQESSLREMSTSSADMRENRLKEAHDRVEAMRASLDSHQEREESLVEDSSSVHSLLREAESKIQERKYLEAFTLIHDAEMHVRDTQTILTSTTTEDTPAFTMTTLVAHEDHVDDILNIETDERSYILHFPASHNPYYIRASHRVFDNQEILRFTGDRDENITIFYEDIRIHTQSHATEFTLEHITLDEDGNEIVTPITLPARD